MDQYYYKLVCVDEANPLEYTILEEKNLDNLDAIHDFVKEHMDEHLTKRAKWILLPFKKEDFTVIKPAVV